MKVLTLIKTSDTAYRIAECAGDRFGSVADMAASRRAASNELVESAQEGQVYRFIIRRVG